jgi:hypothetical protein
MATVSQIVGEVVGTLVLSAVAGEDDGVAVTFDVDVVSGESSFAAR